MEAASIPAVIPEEFHSERLDIRVPRPGDGAAVFTAVRESAAELRLWLPWPDKHTSPQESETMMLAAREEFLRREDMLLLLFLRGTSTLVGGSGLHRMDWSVPRFEIGYWVRSRFAGQGYASEAAQRITEFAFEVLHAKRVEIHVDPRNTRSCRIPERLGFQHEGTLRNYARDQSGRLNDQRIYALVRF